MKAFNFFIILFAFANTAQGQITPLGTLDTDNPKVLLGSQTLRNPGYRDTLFNHRISAKNGDKTRGLGYQANAAGAAVFVLMNTPFLRDAYPRGYTLEVVLNVKFKKDVPFVFDNPLTVEGETTFALNIEYSPGGGEYKNKDTYVLPLVWWADFKVESVTLKPTDGGAALLDGNPFQLYAYLTDKGYIPLQTALKPALNSRVHANKGYLLLDWPEVPGAMAYDIEWTFVDGYGSNPSTQFGYNFRHNATRVTTAKLTYEIPLVFEKGYLLFRARAVAESQVSGWTIPDQGIMVLSGSLPEQLGRGVLPIMGDLVFEQDRLNWQYIAQFAENGKRKDAVSFMDATFRARQTVSKLNTGGKHLLVGETIYDHQGRPSIQVLPTPFRMDAPPEYNPANPAAYQVALDRYNSESPALRYQQNFTQNAQGQAYSRRDFDTDPSGNNRCELPEAPLLGNQSGAGRYYSVQNPNRQGENSYIPDAGGYPFVQVEYTPDNTGRVQRQGGPGQAHQIGGQHEKKFTYGNPTQIEVDRLFGSDAGLACYYQKERMRDENGQWYLTYKNIAGKVVASALTGVSPGNLDALPPAPQGTFANRADLMAESARSAPDGSLQFSSKNIAIAVDSTPFVLHFDLSKAVAFLHNGSCPPAQPLCYDCVYDLEITLLQDCGQVWLRHTVTGTLDQLQGCDGTTLSPLQDTIKLAAGMYTLSHRLTVNENAITAVVNDVMSRDTCWKKGIKEQEGRLPPCEAGTCVPCRFEERTINFHGTSFKVLRRSVQNDPNCRISCFDPATLGKYSTTLSYHLSKWEELLRDVSPMGQYGGYNQINVNPESPATTSKEYSFSVYNPSNQLHMLGGLPALAPNWSFRDPAFEYLNADGSPSEIEVTDDPNLVFNINGVEDRGGRKFIKPGNLFALSDFLKYWKPSWAESLVPFHPEYAYFEWSRQNRDIIRHDSLIYATTSMEDALIRDMILLGDDKHDALLSGIAKQDPLFQGARTQYLTSFVANLEEVGKIGISRTQRSEKIDIFDLMIIGIHCSGPAYGLENDEPVQSVSAEQYNALRACIWSLGLTQIPEDLKNRAWDIFKVQYRAARARALDRIRTAELLAAPNPRRRDNTCIGVQDADCPCQSGLPESDLVDLKKKTRRFSRDNCTNPRRSPAVDEQQRITGYEEKETNLVANKRWERYVACGVCPVGLDVLVLLNGLVYEKRLTSKSVSIGRRSPLLLSRKLTAGFSSYPTESEYEWQLIEGTSNSITAGIFAYGKEVCRLNLASKYDLDWDAIKYFSCMRRDGDQIIVEAYDSLDDTKAHLLYFDSPNLNEMLLKCTVKPPVYQTPEAASWLSLLNYLIATRRYRQGWQTALPIPGYASAGYRGKNTNLGKATAWRTRMESTGFNPPYAVIGSLEFERPQDTCKVEILFDKEVYSAPQLGRVDNLRQYEIPGQNGAIDTMMFKADVETPGYGAGKGTITVKLYCRNKNINPYTSTPKRIPKCCPDPAFPPIIPAPPCDEQLKIVGENNARSRIAAREAQMRREVRLRYVAHCMSGLQQSFTAEWSESIYQATLFYYDRAGNLVKTVPPKGTQPLDEARIANVQTYRNNRSGNREFPDHKAQASGMASSYGFNSLNETVLKTTPDGGTTRYCYDELGRIIMSQDDEQKKAFEQSYLLYDALGRVKESGVSYNYNRPLPTKIRYKEYSNANVPQNWFVNRREVFTTYYDHNRNLSLAQPFFTAGKQEQLRGRIASVTYRAGTSGDYDHATHYTYDVLGNVKELVQEFKKLGKDFPKLAGHSAKLVRYDYDLVTGNVNRITYQPGRQDQFVHWYEYDADNRLTDVFTGLSPLETPMFRHRDAHYEYYLHGPLARLELGHDKVQGLDYTYTIQGWLKSVNSPLLEGARDPGHDGVEGLHAHVPADVFGFGLQYFLNDYRPIARLGSGGLPIPADDIQPLHQQTRDLWNGNISAALCGLNNLPDRTLATAYHYDQLNRLTLSRPFRNTTTSGWAATESWKMALNYDANGNIRYLFRNNDMGASMDALTYQYRNPNNNRLSDISDSAGRLYPAPNAPVQDLPNQAANNYTYDLKGRLATDAAQNATRLTWSNTDKLLYYRQVKSGTTQFEYTYFDYDALGRRVFRRTGKRATYTVRDAQGNPLAEYNLHNDTIFWGSAPIYGAKRLGTYQPNLRLYPYNEFATANRAPGWRGKRRYELTGHTGDVLALVSDCRKATTLNGAMVTTADVRSMQDYYPFGMPMPGRSFTATGEGGYRYGFQGMEKEDGMKGAGNAYTTEFREYDARVGRWLSVDAKAQELPSLSVYHFSYNNPVSFIDLDGRQATGPNDPTPANAQVTTYVPNTYIIANSILERIRGFSPAAANNIRFDPQDTRLLAALNHLSSRNVGEGVAILVASSAFVITHGRPLLYEVYVTRVSHVRPETHLGDSQIAASSSAPSTRTGEYSVGPVTIVGDPLPPLPNSPTTPPTGTVSGHQYAGTAQLSIRVVTTELTSTLDIPHTGTVSRQDFYVPVSVRLTTTESPGEAIPEAGSYPTPVSNAQRQQEASRQQQATDTMDSGVSGHPRSSGNSRDAAVPRDASVPRAAGVRRRE